MEMLYGGSKRILSLLLTFSMVFGSLSPTAFSAYAAEIEEDTVEVVSDSGGEIVEEVIEEEEEESDAQKAGGSAQEESGGQAQEDNAGAGGTSITEDTDGAGAGQVQEPSGKDSAPTQNTADDNTATNEIQEEEEDAEAAQQDAADAGDNTIPEGPEGTSEDVSVSMPAFSQSKTVDGVKVKVTAPEGVFPEGAKLSVEKVELPATAEEAVEEKRDENAEVVKSYTFDIKVLDADGCEIQPPEGAEVKVSFTLDEVADKDLDTNVYHVEETEDGGHEADKLDTTEKGRTVTAVTDGFSLYTVEFTVNGHLYEVNVGTEVRVRGILESLGISFGSQGEVVNASASGPVAVSGSRNDTTVKVTEEFAGVTTLTVQYTEASSQYDITPHEISVSLTCKQVVHTHTYEASLNDAKDTLAVSCQNTDGLCTFSGTKTYQLKDNGSAVYDGKKHELTLESPADTLAGINVSSIAYKDEQGRSVTVPVNAGIYTGTVEIEVPGCGAFTLTRNLEISKAEITAFDWGAITVDYDGTDKTPTVTVSAPAISSAPVEAVVKVTNGGTGTLTNGKPVNKGTYNLTVTGLKSGSESGNYALPANTDTRKNTLTINALNLQEQGYTIDVACTPSYNYYTGSDNPPTSVSVKARKSGSEKELVEGTDYTISYLLGSDSPVTPKEVGKYSAGIQFKGNYTYASNGKYLASNVYEIKKQTAEQNADKYSVSLENWTYGDTAKTPVVRDVETSSVPRYTISYKPANASDSAYTDQVPEKPGRYTVRATITETETVEAVKVTSEFEIEKRYLVVKAKDENFTYGDALPAFDFEVENDQNNKYKNMLTGSLKAEGGAKDAGTYTIGQGTLRVKSEYQDKVAFDFTEGTLTIAQRTANFSWGADSFDYDGQKHCPEATVSNLVSGDSCTVTVSGAQTDAGSYTASVTGLSNPNYVLGNTSANKEQSFTIGKKDVSSYTLDVACEPYTKNYNGEPQAPDSVTVKLIGSDGDKITLKVSEYTIKYYSSEVSSAQTRPVEASAYKAVVILGSKNYESSNEFTTSSTVFKILPVSASLGVAFTGWTYGEDPRSVPVLTGADASKVTHVDWQYKKAAEGEDRYTTTRPTDADTYTVRGVVTMPNHEAVPYPEQNFTIAPRELIVTAKNDAEKGYGKSDDDDWYITVSADNLAPHETVNDALTGRLTRKAGEDVGTYAITQGTLKTKNSNYVIREFVEGTLTIKPRIAEFNWDTDTFTYDGDSHCPVATMKNLKDGDDCEVTVSGAKKDVGDNYVATVTSLSNNNYTLSRSQTKTHNFSITEKDVTEYKAEAACTPSSKVYNGEPLTPDDVTVTLSGNGEKVALKPAEYEITYSTSPSGGGGDPAPVEAGKYYAKIKLIGTAAGNYSQDSFVTQNTVFEIKPASVDLGLAITGWTYGDQANTPKFTGRDAAAAEAATHHFEYKKADEDDDKFSTNTPAEAGSYTARAIVDLPNYDTYPYPTQNFTIAPRELTVTAKHDAEKEYGEPDKEDWYRPIAVDNLAYGHTADDVLTGRLAREAGEAVGTYAITQGTLKSKSSNYTIGEFVGGALTITPRTATFGNKGTSFAYNGKEQCPEFTVTNLVDDDECEVTVEGGQTRVGSGYRATAVKLSNPNYRLPDDLGDKQYAFEITKFVVEGWTLEAVCDPDFRSYTGKENGPTKVSVRLTKEGEEDFIPAANEYEYEFILLDDKGNETTTVVKEPIEVGKYKLQIKLDRDSYQQNRAMNVTLKTADPVYEIIPDDSELRLAITGWTYGEQQSTPQLFGQYEADVDSATTYEYKKSTDDDDSYKTYATDTRLDAGDYKMRAKVVWVSGKNHTLTSAPESDFTVRQRAIVVGAVDSSKTYGAADPALTVEITGSTALAQGDSLDTVLGGKVVRGEGEDVGTYAITQGSLEVINDNYELRKFVEGTFTINRDNFSGATLTITPEEGQSKVYGEEDPEFTYTVSGSFQNGDDASTAITGKLGRVKGEAVGTYTYTLGTLKSKNYNIVLAQGSRAAAPAFKITPRTVELVWSDTELTYNGKSQAPTARIANLVDGDDVAVTVNGAQTDAGTYTASADSLTGAASGNYQLPENKSTKFTIKKLDADDTGSSVEVFINPSESVYDGTQKPLKYSVRFKKDGVVTTLTPGTDFEAALIPGVDGAPTDAGVYTLKVTLKGNYKGEAEATYEIKKADQTVSIATEDWTYGDTPKAATTTNITPDAGHGAVTYWYKPIDADDSEYTTKIPVNAGRYLACATVAETDNYNAAISEPVSFLISRADLTVIPDEISKQYGETDPSLTYKIAAATELKYTDKAADVLTGSLSRYEGEAVGEYEIIQGTLEANGNYRLTVEPGKLFTITEGTITISVDNAEKTYGEADPAFTYTVVGGLRNGDTEDIITGSLRREDPTNNDVGTYPILCDGLSAGKNYQIVMQAPANLTIKPAEAKVVPGTNTSFYRGDIKDPLAYTVEGMAYNEDWKDVLNFELSTVATTTSLPGFYDYRLKVTNSAGSDKNKNYTIKLDETPKYEITTTDASVDAANYYGFYDGQPHTITVTVKDRDGNDLTKTPGEGYSKAAVVYYSTEELDETNYDTAGKPLDITFTEVTDGPQNVYYFVKFHEGVSSKDLKGVATVTILPRVITIKADAGQKKVYGQKDPDRFKYTIEDPDTTFVGSDSAASVISGKLARVEGEDVGLYEIGIGTLTATKNYTFSYTPADFEITPATIHVTVDEKTKGYGAPDPELTYTVRQSDLKNGDTAESVMDGYLVREPGEDKGDYDIYLGTLNAGSNYVIATDTNGDPDINGTKKFHITIATLKVTADDKTRSYGKPNPRLTYKVEGLVNGDLADEVLTGELNCKADENSAVGEYPIEQGSLAVNPANPSVQAGNYNYKIDYIEGTLTITDGEIYVFADEIEKTYGEDDPDLTYTAEYSDGTPVATGTSLRGKLAREKGEDAGEYEITQGTLYDPTGNYSINFVSNTFTIRPAELTVTADNLEKEYGEEDPEFTYDVTGLQFADTEEAVLAGSLSRKKGEKTGTYPINRGDLHVTTDNYKLVFVQGSLKINTKNLYIVVDNLEKTYGDLDPEFTFHSVDGDLVPGDLETVIKNSLYRVDGEEVGKYEIKVDNLAAANYSIKLQAPGYLTIKKKDVKVVPGRNSSFYLQDIKDPLDYTVEGMAFNEDWNDVLNFTLSTVATNHDLPGEYDYSLKVTNTSDPAVNKNYNITLDTEPKYIITNTDASVEVKNIYTVYDGQQHAIEVKAYDRDGNDLTVATTGHSKAATVYYSLEKLDEKNYNTAGEALEIPFKDVTDGRQKVYYYVKFHDGVSSEDLAGVATVTIVPRMLKVTADPDQKKIYGEKDPDEFTYTIADPDAETGFVGTDITGLTGALTRVEGENVGKYQILLGSLYAGPNYTIYYKPDYFEITKAELHIKANANEKVYGDEDPELTYTVDKKDLLLGDTEAILDGELSRGPGEDVDVYPIYLGMLNAGGNYEIVYTGADFTIKPADLMVKADDQVIPFGSPDPEFTYTVTGLKFNDLAEEVLTGSLAHDHVDGEEVGEYPIRKGTLEVVDNAAGNKNYKLKFTQGTLYVEPAVLTVRGIKALDKVYDGTTTAEFDTSDLTVEGLVASKTNLVVKASGYFSDKNVGWNKTVIINGLTLEGPDKKNYTLANTGSQVTAKATIYARVIAVTRDITAEDKTYDGTTDAVLDASNAKLELRNQEKCYNSVDESKTGENGKTVNEVLIEGDDIWLLARGHFEDKTAVEVVEGRDTRKKVFIDEIFFEGEDQINYKLFDDSVVTDTDMNQRTSVNQKFAFAKIWKRQVTVPYGIYAVDRIYDGTTDATDLIRNELATIDNKVVEDDLHVAVDALFETPDVGKDKEITFEHMRLYGDDSANYVLAKEGNQLTTTADITPREVFVTADDQEDEYLAKIHPLTFTTSEVPGVAESGLVNEKDAEQLKVTLETDATNESSAGIYTIFADQEDDHTLNYLVYFRNGTYTINQADAVIIANDYDGVYDGQSHGIGVYVRDTRMDDNLDLPGRKFTDQKEFTKNEANIYYSTETELTADNYEQMGTKEEPVFKDVTDEPVKVYYYVELRDNYADKYPDSRSGYRTVNITPAPLRITADAKSKVYGDADPELTYKATGFVAGESAKTVMTGELTRDKGEDVGVYTIRQGTLSAGKNYEITYQSAKLTITKRKVTVKADDKTSKYNQAIKKLTWSLVQGRIIGNDKLNVILTTTAKKGSNVGKYPIKGTCDEKNYTVTVQQGTYTIVKADQAAPAAPVVKKVTTTTIVVKARKGEEYSINKGLTWKRPANGASKVTFSGLTPNKKYTVYARKYGTKNYNPSPKSNGTNTRTLEDGLDKFGGLIITTPGKNINVKWDAIRGAEGYLVYAVYCGKDFPTTPTMVVKGKYNTDITITKLNGKAVDQTQDFKLYLKAYKTVNGKRVIICTSIDAHVGGNKRKSVTNAVAVNATPTTATLRPGMQIQISAEIILQYANRSQLSSLHCPVYRYTSTNTKVATVSSTGVITAKKKGSCLVYVYAKNARAKAIKIEVK